MLLVMGSSMSRNRVRSGVIDQRARRTTRRRRRRPVSANVDADELLQALLSQFGDVCVEDAERISLDDVVDIGRSFSVEPAEALRRAAIVVESQVAFDGWRGWLVLHRLYAEAHRMSPDDVAVVHSAALSAHRFDEERVRREGRRWLSAGRERFADDVDLIVLDGMYLYDDGEIKQALSLFDDALQLAPSTAWAQLYRAHCLHDLERWPEALDAYVAVDRSAFVGAASWRVDVLREQLALCRLQCGAQDAAVDDVMWLLERYEREPHLAEAAMSQSLTDVVSLLGDAALSSRLKALEAAVFGPEA